MNLSLYERKVAQGLVKVAFFLLLALGLAVVFGPYLVNLFPVTKVVTVSMRSSEWIVGEYRTCSSIANPSGEITLLDCGGGDSDEAQHSLGVTFRGQTDTPNRPCGLGPCVIVWNCQRIQESDGVTSVECRHE